MSNKNREKKQLLFAIIIFVIIVMVTILFYFIYYLRSDQIISRAVDAFIKSYKDAILYNYEITPTISNANSEKISDYTLDIINHMDLSLSMKNNADNMNIILDINSNYKKDPLLNMQIISDLVTKETFAYCKDIINIHFLEELDDNTYFILYQLLNNQKSSKQKINKNHEIIKNEILNILKETDFSKENGTTEINGKNVKTEKNTLKITLKELCDNLKKSFENLYNNQEFINAYDDTEMIKENINRIIDKLNNEEESEAVVEFNIYTEGYIIKKVVKIEMNINDSETKKKIEIDTNKMQKKKGTAYVSIEISDLGQIDLEIDYTKNKDTKIKDLTIDYISTTYSLSDYQKKVVYANLVGTKLYEILDKEGLIEEKFEMTEEEIEKYKTYKNAYEQEINDIGTAIYRYETR